MLEIGLEHPMDEYHVTQMTRDLLDKQDKLRLHSFPESESSTLEQGFTILFLGYF